MKNPQTITVSPDEVETFYTVFQGGFSVDTRAGRTITDFLCEDIGVLPEYVSDRLQVIFLNGKPVDDPARATLRGGSRLSLSAAAPGLVGVTLKKGSILASFRAAISHREEAGSAEGDAITIRVKLFNLTARDLGEAFLRHGIETRRDLLPKALPYQGENGGECNKEERVRLVLRSP